MVVRFPYGDGVTGLEQHLHSALPHLSFRMRAIFDAMLLAHGAIGSSARVAHRVGLSNRFALSRIMRREGLPALHELAAWISVLEWTTAAARRRTSLFELATRSHRSPAATYRLVKRLTGLTWVQLQARGASWVLRLFVHRCQAISLAAPPLSSRVDRAGGLKWTPTREHGLPSGLLLRH